MSKTRSTTARQGPRKQVWLHVDHRDTPLWDVIIDIATDNGQNMSQTVTRLLLQHPEVETRLARALGLKASREGLG